MYADLLGSPMSNLDKEYTYVILHSLKEYPAFSWTQVVLVDGKIFATLADYSGKKPEDLFILKLKRKKPINLEVIYLSFEFEKDYFDFIGYKNNKKPFILDSKQIKRLITANKMNKTSDNKLAKLLVNEIYYSDSISFYGPDYGLKKNSVNQNCDSELKLINKPEKIF